MTDASSAKQKWCYKTKTLRNVALGGIAILVSASIDMWRHPAPGDSLGFRVFFSVGFVAITLFMLLRVVPAGAYPKADGLKVRNLFRTSLIPWDQIQGFSLKMWRWWNRQPMGHVEKMDGTSVNISGIQANNIGKRAAQRAVDELNALLTQRN